MKLTTADLNTRHQLKDSIILVKIKKRAVLFKCSVSVKRHQRRIDCRSFTVKVKSCYLNNDK